MSDTDSLDYLQADFDPTSFTVPHLRSILVKHDIDYPSAAKKSQLIEIFINRVLPLRSKILKDRDSARRSSRGITNVDSGENFEPEKDIVLPPRTPRKSSRKTSARLATVADDDEFRSRRERTRSPVKTMAKVSSKHTRTSDTEIGIDPEARRKSSRKTRKSATPSYQQSEPSKVKYDILDDGAGVKIVKRRETAFTYDNPFQSGSSPTTVPSSIEKRRSLGASVIKERRKASGYGTRRKTDIPQINDGIRPPSRAIFEANVPITGMKEVDHNGVETGEEFTMEEQLELSRERASKGLASPGPLRPKAKPYRGFNLKIPIYFMILVIVGGYAYWYRHEKIAVGFCDVGRNSSRVPYAWEAPNWIRILAKPNCEPCPQHAYCYSNMKAECEHDYLFKAHPLSYFNIIPLSPKCEADGAKVRKVTAFADRAVEELRERRADFECGNLRNEASVPMPSVEIDADDLKKVMSKRREKGKTMTEAEFEDLWPAALLEIKGRDEVLSQTDGIHTNLTSVSLARLPLQCALRRSIRNKLAENFFWIGGLILLFLLSLYSRSILISRRRTNAAIPNLVSLTLERLSHQAALHEQNSDINRWISIGQLRDDVLRNEHSITKREMVWRKVRSVIEMNANVRSSQKEDRNGEVSRVWEWIGAVDGIEGSARRRRSGRIERDEVSEFGIKMFKGGSNSLPEISPPRSNDSRPVY